MSWAADAGFYTELYAALRHIMLAPLMDTSKGAGGRSSTSGMEQGHGMDKWLGNAQTAAEAHVNNAVGGQVSLQLPECCACLQGKEACIIKNPAPKLQVCYLACQALERLLLHQKTLDSTRQVCGLDLASCAKYPAMSRLW